MCGKFRLDFPPDQIKRNAPLRCSVCRSLVQEALKSDTVVQLLYLTIEIIRFCETIFASILCKQKHRTFPCKFKNLNNIDCLFSEVNELQS